jgi:hypothetical protein
MNLIRDVLDKPLVDHRHDPMGKADGLLVEVRDGQPPRVVAIESGFPVLARRIHPTWEPIARWIGRVLRSPRRGQIYRIPWADVKAIEKEIELNLDANHTPAMAWEKFWADHFTRKIPGSGR